MSIETIVASTKAKVAEMGGGEQFIGKMFDLAGTCDVHGEDGVFGWMADLGDALDKAGLQLTSGAGRPQDLYASPKEG